MKTTDPIARVLGTIPNRLQLAGGWIDQPFVSQHNPSPTGSMVVVAIEPNIPFMGRSGMGTSTRRIAEALWGGTLPDRDPRAEAWLFISIGLIGTVGRRLGGLLEDDLARIISSRRRWMTGVDEPEAEVEFRGA